MNVLARNVLASLMSRGWVSLLSLGLVPVYIRLLGVEAYGVIGAFVSIQALISLLDLGMGASLTRELARLTAGVPAPAGTRSLLRTLELLYWAAAAAIGAAIAGLSPFLAHHWLKSSHLSPGEMTMSLLLAGMSFAFQWPTNLYAGGLAGLHEQTLLGWITATLGTLRAIATLLALHFIAPTLEVFFATQAAANLMQTACVARALWNRLRSTGEAAVFSAPQLRTVLRFAGGMSAISLTAVVLTQLDKAILSRLLTLEAFGYYSVASALAAGIYILISPLFAVMFPKFSQIVAAEDNAALVELYHFSSQLMTVAVLPFTAVVALFSRKILFLWTANSAVAENSSLPLSLLIVGNSMNGLMNIPYALQLAYGWTRLALAANIVAIVVFAPAIYLLSVRLGPVGGALAWLCLSVTYILTCPPVMHHKLLRGELWRWYWNDTTLPALAILAVTISGRIWLPPMARLATLLSLLGLGAVAMAGAALVAPSIRSTALRYLSRTYAAA